MKCDIERKEKYEKNTEAEILAMFEWQRTDRLNFLQNFDATQLKHAERRLKYVKLLELIVNTVSWFECWTYFSLLWKKLFVQSAVLIRTF
jgi:hypothetical protein